MGNFLDNNQRDNIRKKISEDIIVYEPTLEQKKSIMEMLNNQNLFLDNKLTVEGEIDYDIIRYIIKECCQDGNFIEDITDEEIEYKILNGNRNLKALEDEIVSIIEECIQDFQKETIKKIEAFNNIMQMISMGNSLDNLKDTFNKEAKSMGLNQTFEDLIKMNKNDN